MICDQWKRAQIVSKIENESVINEANKLRIVEKGFSSKTTESYFVVDLKQQFLLNRLKLKIYPSKSYAVCVSTDLHDWELVIDHSRHKCFGLQWLYFEERPVRFIRIHCDQSYNTYVKAFYSTIPFNFYIASPLTVRKLYETYAELKLLNGVTVRSNDSHYMQKRGDDILFQLSQPFYLTRIKLLLKKMSSYYIEISTNKENWTRVFEEEQVTGNRMAIFEKQPVSFIKIVGTHKVLNFFCLYKIEFS
uniref:F5/8 type C domain-containing protein n=1 Tax=Panagrellus redivivus TaxID=6233 RepID=A0A7E4VMI8_PANRE